MFNCQNKKPTHSNGNFHHKKPFFDSNVKRSKGSGWKSKPRSSLNFTQGRRQNLWRASSSTRQTSPNRDARSRSVSIMTELTEEALSSRPEAGIPDTGPAGYKV